MTGDTIVRVIIFLIMLLIHFVVIMAGAARIIGRVATRMTFGTVAIRILMVNGESMIERRIPPGITVVAVGTLSLEVIRRPCMAGLAIRQPTVIKIHIPKVACILMAACTCTGIMIAGRVMAGRAILTTDIGMTKRRIAEIICILMTACTRSAIMTLRRIMA